MITGAALDISTYPAKILISVLVEHTSVFFLIKVC